MGYTILFVLGVIIIVPIGIIIYKELFKYLKK